MLDSTMQTMQGLPVSFRCFTLDAYTTTGVVDSAGTSEKGNAIGHGRWHGLLL